MSSKTPPRFIIAAIKENGVFIYGYQNAVIQLEAVFSSRDYRRLFLPSLLYAMLNSVCSKSWLRLISEGRLRSLLVKRLLYFKGKCAVSNPLGLGISALSRHHFFNESTLTCVATTNWYGHLKIVRSVAFHPTAPLIATDSGDNTAKLWRFSPEDSNVTCLANLRGYSCDVNTVKNIWNWYMNILSDK
jgi:WD40 repeat protein